MKVDLSSSPLAAPLAEAVNRVRRGAHRLPEPPNSLRGRVAVVAIAAGALFAAGQSSFSSGSSNSSTTAQIAFVSEDSALTGANTVSSDPATASLQTSGLNTETSDETSTSPEVLNVANAPDIASFSSQLDKGAQFAQKRADREAAARRPLFALPTTGIFTSVFGMRWGALHAGVDIANAIGTPVYAAADGTVIDSGPTDSGFGQWVRIKHYDGTITLYGHIETYLVKVGQQVTAGDQIATIGNRGYSTGPHLHFEVWLNGTDKSDPLPWLAARGISLGKYTG
ncbi:MAG: M23 family metallopeptidase [Mycobacteriaceae bacterium]